MPYEEETSKAQNRRARRNKRKSWEKLGEKPIAGIDTLPGGGLVSSPISGKALGPTIGSGSAPRDLNPATAIDADADLIVLEGIPTINAGRGIPDPTPGNRVSGRMGREQNKEEFVGLDKLLRQHFSQFAKFQEWIRNKDWNAFHRNHYDWWMFPIPRGSNTYRDEYNIAGEPLQELLKNNRYLSSLKSAMEMYTRSIGWDLLNRRWIEDADIDNGQEPVRSLNRARLYKIAQSAEAHGLYDELDSVSLMVSDMRRGGIAVGNEQYWDGISGRMGDEKLPRPNFPALAKVGDEFETGIPGDNRKWKLTRIVGAERRQVWMRTDTPGLKPVSTGIRKAGGSGGKSISPSATSIRADLTPTTRPYDSPEFTSFWEKRDRENEIGDGDNLTFDWRDEESRKWYIEKFGAIPTRHPKSRKNVGWAKFGGGNKPGVYPSKGVAVWVDVLRDELRDLGLSIIPKEHSTMGDQYGGWLSFSGTPGAASSEAQAAKQLLTHLSESISPQTFYQHFEAWIRNPFVTGRRDGRQVGVRLAFNNDRERLLNEYRRRIIALRDGLYEHFGNELDDAARTMVLPVIPDSQVGKTVSSSTGNDWLDLSTNAPWAGGIIKSTLADIVKSEKPRNADRLKYLLGIRLQSKLGSELQDFIASSETFIPGLLQEVEKNRDWGNTPEFFEPDILPSGDLETLEIVDQLADEFLNGITPDTENRISITDGDARGFIELVGDESINKTVVKPYLQQRADLRNAGGGISGRMGNTPEKNIEASDTGYHPEDPKSLGNHFTSKHPGYSVRPPAVKTIAEAAETGAPLEWLTPGSYHPRVQELINQMIDTVIETGFTTYLETNPDYFEQQGLEESADKSAALRAKIGSWVSAMVKELLDIGDFSEDFELADDDKELISTLLGTDIGPIKRFSEIPKVDPDGRGGNTMQLIRSLILRNSKSSASSGGEAVEHSIATGLLMRAIHAGLKVNNMRRLGLSDYFDATQETLDWWNESITAALFANSPSDADADSIDGLLDRSEISIAMPFAAAIEMLNSGEFKTLFDTGTSMGNSNKSARAAAEFALFGILPSYKGKRPIYGVLHVDGITETAISKTEQYGPVRIVLKRDVNKNATWTEMDSLALMSSASTLSQPSKDSLYSQRFTIDTPFTNRTAEDLIAMIERGRAAAKDDKLHTQKGRSQYSEAQIHAPIGLDDIAYIIIDDSEFTSYMPSLFPIYDSSGRLLDPDSPEYESARDAFPDDIMDYEGFIQISRIAESLNIPIVIMSDVLYAGEEIIRP